MVIVKMINFLLKRKSVHSVRWIIEYVIRFSQTDSYSFKA